METKTIITNPRIYTKNSLEYYFVWDWQVVDENNQVVNEDPIIDLTQKYEVLFFQGLGFVTPCNLNNLLEVTYNEPIPAFKIPKRFKYIEELCARESNFLIPDLCSCKFKIRKKDEENPISWDNVPLSDNVYSIMPVPQNCGVVATDTNNNKFSFNVDSFLKNNVNTTNNPLSKYIINTFEETDIDLHYPQIPSDNCYFQSSVYSTIFQFNLYYNSRLKLNENYTTSIVYKRQRSNNVGIVDLDKIKPLVNQVVDKYDINIDYDEEITGYTHNLPNENGGIVYIEDGEGWTINQETVSAGHTYVFKNCGTLTFNRGSSTTGLKGHFFTAPFEQTTDLGRELSIKTGWKYLQQPEAFDDLNTIQPTSMDISNNTFDYQYNQIDKHTPVFIYQKQNNDGTYKLTNSNSNDYRTGTIDINNGDLKITTSPVINYKYISEQTLPSKTDNPNYIRINLNSVIYANVKKFIVSNITSSLDNLGGYVELSYDDDTSFENAQIIEKNDAIDITNYNYLNLRFVNTSNIQSSIKISYFLEYDGQQILKPDNITEAELNEYLDNHHDMLKVNQALNSLHEEFTWGENNEKFKIIEERGNPLLIMQGKKPKLSEDLEGLNDIYTYKVLIQNQMSNREIVNKELNLVVYDEDESNQFWCIENSLNGYLLTDLKENELSSKDKYHIIIKRIYNDNEYILEERDIEYENNSDFFLAPTNNINYNPGEEVDFYFSTERNNSENAAQGYPWLIYNNEDNVSYFCYSNHAKNNLGSESIINYDESLSDNKQLIHINYHDKPNFTPKEIIPMLDFKITELVKTNSDTIINSNSISNQTNITLTANSNGVNIQTNGENASFTISTSFVNNNYLSFKKDGNSSILGMGQIEILDNDTKQILFSTANNGSCFVLTNLWDEKYVSNNTTLLFNFKSNGYINFYNTCIQTLKKPETDTLLNKRKFYIDNFSVNEIDYSEIENGSVISGQVLQLHKPVTLYISNFNDVSNSIYYKIEKVNEYNQDVLTPVDDANSISLVQNYNSNEFTKDFYINSHTNQLKIQNTKTKQITFNNAQKDTIVNCVLEKEEVEN